MGFDPRDYELDEALWYIGKIGKQADNGQNQG